MLSFDGGPGAAPLPVLGHLAVVLALLAALVLLLRPVPLHVWALGLPLHGQLVPAAAAAALGHDRAVAGVEVEVVAGVRVGHLGADGGHAAVGVLDVVYLAEEVALVVAADLVALGEVGGAVSAGEAVDVEQGLTDLPHLVRLGEDQLAGRAPWSEHSVEILLAVELTELGEAGGGEGGPAGRTLETVLMERTVTHSQYKLVLYRSVTLTTDFHIRHPLVLGLQARRTVISVLVRPEVSDCCNTARH